MGFRVGDGIKLNVACGNNKIPGFVNIDSEVSVNPDVVLDIKYEGLSRYGDNSVSSILFFHAIEHIEEKFHKWILAEFWRVLETDGVLMISYPEFVKCAQNYIDNYKGMKEFWKHTIYGLQRYPGDFHVSLMDSREFINVLRGIGFKDLIVTSEPMEHYNTVLRAVKGPKTLEYEELIKREVIRK